MRSRLGLGNCTRGLPQSTYPPVHLQKLNSVTWRDAGYNPLLDTGG
jgi:hypothetical protein